MYRKIYQAYQNLSKGDQAELKRCGLEKLADTPAYFRVLKYSGAKDNAQSQRILYLLVGIDIGDDEEALPVVQAMLKAGVKERQIIQIHRGGDNDIVYLKRQLVRCKNINIKLDNLGQIAQFWGDNTRRKFLKEFILSANDPV